jgi:hypothetical protein
MTTGQHVHGYKIVQLSTHYRIIDGAVYRDAVAVRLTDNAVRAISVLDGPLGRAA